MKLLKKPRVTEARKEAIREVVYRRRYLVPNLVTVGNMFCGYLAIFYSNHGLFEKALWAIMVAIVLDGLDGRVARSLKATSKFGMEFDSFSDMVSFGVAPAVLMYNWGLQTVADDLGILFSFLYLLCAASRLARFNLATENLKGFTGLPSPAAAGSIVSIIFLCVSSTDGILRGVLAALSLATFGLLMVSKVEYFSIKVVRLRRGVIPLILIAAIIGLGWYSPKVGLFTVAMLYCLSGPLRVHRWFVRG